MAVLEPDAARRRLALAARRTRRRLLLAGLPLSVATSPTSTSRPAAKTPTATVSPSSPPLSLATGYASACSPARGRALRLTPALATALPRRSEPPEPCTVPRVLPSPSRDTACQRCVRASRSSPRPPHVRTCASPTPRISLPSPRSHAALPHRGAPFPCRSAAAAYRRPALLRLMLARASPRLHRSLAARCATAPLLARLQPPPLRAAAPLPAPASPSPGHPSARAPPTTRQAPALRRTRAPAPSPRVHPDGCLARNGAR
nr:serine/arginine repetitive matrix protein 1-like [Aegilops tauschii subsp. strangulata]